MAPELLRPVIKTVLAKRSSVGLPGSHWVDGPNEAKLCLDDLAEALVQAIADTEDAARRMQALTGRPVTIVEVGEERADVAST